MKKNESLGLYIHIPFCVKKCLYCDFLSFGGTAQTTKDLYIEALCKELNNLSASFSGRSLSTIYIGGGTPSTLSEDNFLKLMTSVGDGFSIEEDAEITMEMNPGTVTETKLELYRDCGVNRISMGLQSDDDTQLKKLGRIHTYENYRDTYELMRAKGFDNINVDVMFGLDNQSMDQWQRTLETVIELNPEHISAYSLIIESDTPYDDLYENNKLSLPNEDEERAMFWYTHQRLGEAGYGHYEISNYAKEGLESRHNSSYWNLTPYIGAGLGASSFYGNVRYKNITNMDDYIKGMGDLNVVREVEAVNDEAINLEEAFFLGLRQLKGINLQWLEESFTDERLKPYRPIIHELVNDGLLIMKGDYLCLTRRGVDISNTVMSRFIL